MIRFFFYNNLCNLELIRNISPFYQIKYGYTYVKLFDKAKNKLTIDDNINENTQILQGTLVSFSNLTLSQIIYKLSKIDEIKYKNRDLYKLEKIYVYFEGKDYTDRIESYIIY